MGATLPAGQLRLEALVGTGSFAEVWRARDPKGRVVALKRMLPHVARNSSAVAAFEREARLLGRVNHAGIVGLVGWGTDEAGPYLVLEYVDGTSLGELLGEAVPARLALRVVHDILGALETVHELTDEQGHRMGLVHRDLAPGNVLISFAGEVKLADFGIARAHIGTLATTGVLAKGTLGYMSPEQARGEPLDARSDLFAAGALLHELLSGLSPYDESDPKLALARARAGDVAAFSQRMPLAEPALCDLVDRALSARPADRFSSAAAMRSELLLVARGAQQAGHEALASDAELGTWARAAPRRETPLSEVTGYISDRRHGTVHSARRMALVAALIAALGAGGALWWAGARRATIPPLASSAASEHPQLGRSAVALASELPASSAPAPLESSPLAAPPRSARTAPLPARSQGAAQASADKATLDIGSEPSFAYVSIDGRPIGSTPLFGHRLEPGTHVVVVRREGLGSKTFTIELRPGAHVSKVVKLP